MSRFRRGAALVGISLLFVSACGSDDPASDASTPAAPESTAGSPSSTPESAAPSTEPSTGPSTESSATPESTVEGEYSVEAANGTVTLPGKPAKIVSLSPTHTEMLFAIGAGDQVIAVDDQSNYPEAALAVQTDLSGFTPNVESIASYGPDLVVIADDFNGLGEQLTALDIPVWSGPSAVTLDDSYAQIEQLGVLTGHVGDATELVGQMTTDIEAALADVPETEVPLTYYHELDSTLFSITSNTFIGQVYSLVGLRNIADTAEAGNDYPQLNTEFIVTNNPDLIFLADTKCCGESQTTVAARDGWADIAAVKNGNVVEMDDDIASRWGPRVVDYVRAVVESVKTAAGAPAG